MRYIGGCKRDKKCTYWLSLLFAVLFGCLFSGIPGCGGCLVVRAASVTWKTPYYVTTKVGAKKLKKGKKAKVTVTVKNTCGKEMKNISLKATLPSQLKKVKGNLKKTKVKLLNGKSVSYSFYVKAKKTLTFKKKVFYTSKVTGLFNDITAKNQLKCGSKLSYLNVKLSFSKSATNPVNDNTPEAILDDLYMYSWTDPANPRPYMSGLLYKMNIYAKKKNSNFAMISNGGYDLYMPNADTQDVMLSAVDGVLVEEAFSSEDSSDEMLQAMNAAMKAGKKAFAIEYDGGIEEYNDEAASKGILCYSSEESDLSTIPPFRNQTYNVNSLKDVKNFMAILDPSNYSKKKDYLAALKATDYDLIFVDLFFDENGTPLPLTEDEVKSLKQKKNGGSRMVCSYLSVGEAENYRYYWESAWNNKTTRPDWICEENSHWPGNFTVKYWRPEWQKILYGNNEGYLDMIIAAGFDGVYLDVIDAYDYFERLNSNR